MDLWKKFLKLSTQSQESSSWIWKVLTWEIAAFESLKPDLNLKPPVCIVASYADEFLVDSFCAPSFDPKIFAHTSFVFLAHISALKSFMNVSNWEGSIGFHDFFYENLLSQFLLQDYRLCYHKVEFMGRRACIEIGGLGTFWSLAEGATNSYNGFYLTAW